MLRSAFVSLFWVVFCARKRRTGYTLQALADAAGKDKSEISRGLGGQPNWTLNTVADIAHALDLDIRIEARERQTGTVFTPAGDIRTHPHTEAFNMGRFESSQIRTSSAPVFSQDHPAVAA